MVLFGKRMVMGNDSDRVTYQNLYNTKNLDEKSGDEVISESLKGHKTYTAQKCYYHEEVIAVIITL